MFGFGNYHSTLDIFCKIIISSIIIKQLMVR